MLELEKSETQVHDNLFSAFFKNIFPHQYASASEKKKKNSFTFSPFFLLLFFLFLFFSILFIYFIFLTTQQMKKLKQYLCNCYKYFITCI